MSDILYTKSELCKNAGITPETLRHYVDIGLIKPKEVTEKGYRKYDRDNILDLWFYRLGASLGNPLKEVKKWNTAMSMENFQLRLEEREQELMRTIGQLERQLTMIREIRYYTEKELKADQTVTEEPGLEGWLAFCDSGPAAQRQIARLAEWFPMVSIVIEYPVPEKWREIPAGAGQKRCPEPRLGICLLEEQAGAVELPDMEGLEKMPAMDSLCMSLVTDRPFEVGWEEFLPLLEETDRKGYALQSGILGSLFCREMDGNQARYLLKCRVLCSGAGK